MQNELKKLKRQNEIQANDLQIITENLETERAEFKKQEVETEKTRRNLEKQLTEAKRELESATIAVSGILNTSSLSEDYGKPLETPKVTFGRRLSLKDEMEEQREILDGGMSTYATPGASARTPIRQTETSAGQSAFLKQLGELISRDDRKNIPHFRGDGDLFAGDWLREAERVARTNEWDDSQKIRFFGDRLKGEAREWHMELLERYPEGINYNNRKKELQKRFTDESDIEKLKTKLKSLKQMPDQRVRSFISRINNLFDMVHGKEQEAAEHSG